MHFNKSPHASEHIYYPFSGTAEPGEIGVAESTGASLGNELRGSGGWGRCHSGGGAGAVPAFDVLGACLSQGTTIS